ncbi:MAG: type II toxin-antitoxin system RelE/ParE family toxin [Pedosphaera sp.]|nr:type II toxin-antitoxin system RelE/ParE family toxin [Pedosphaera sp.]
MRYGFHDQARIELLESASFYEGRNIGLGTAFTNEIESTIRRIVSDPGQPRCIEGDVRRCLTKRFPYGILYTIEPEFILIIAIMHCSRKPGY